MRHASRKIARSTNYSVTSAGIRVFLYGSLVFGFFLAGTCVASCCMPENLCNLSKNTDKGQWGFTVPSHLSLWVLSWPHWTVSRTPFNKAADHSPILCLRLLLITDIPYYSSVLREFLQLADIWVTLEIWEQERREDRPLWSLCAARHLARHSFTNALRSKYQVVSDPENDGNVSFLSSYLVKKAVLC